MNKLKVYELHFSDPKDPHTGFLSNSSRHYFNLNGKRYKTIIHCLYSKLFEGTKLEEEILTADTVEKVIRITRPRKVMRNVNKELKKVDMYGKNSDIYLSDDYIDIIKDSLYDCLSAKFVKSALKTKLLGTYPTKLINDGGVRIFKFNIDKLTADYLTQIRDSIHPRSAKPEVMEKILPSIKDIESSELNEKETLIRSKLIDISLTIMHIEGWDELFPGMVEDMIILITPTNEMKDDLLDYVNFYKNMKWNDIYKNNHNFKKLIMDVYSRIENDKIQIASIMIASIIRWIKYYATPELSSLLSSHIDKVYSDRKSIILPNTVREYRHKIPPSLKRSKKFSHANHETPSPIKSKKTRKIKKDEDKLKKRQISRVKSILKKAGDNWGILTIGQIKTRIHDRYKTLKLTSTELKAIIKESIENNEYTSPVKGVSSKEDIKEAIELLKTKEKDLIQRIARENTKNFGKFRTKQLKEALKKKLKRDVLHISNDEIREEVKRAYILLNLVEKDEQKEKKKKEKKKDNSPKDNLKETLFIKDEPAGTFLVKGNSLDKYRVKLLSIGGYHPRKRTGGKSSLDTTVIVFRGKNLTNNLKILNKLGGEYPIRKGTKNTNIMKFKGKSLEKNRRKLEELGGKYPRSTKGSMTIDDTTSIRFPNHLRGEVINFIILNFPEDAESLKYTFLLREWLIDKITMYLDTTIQVSKMMNIMDSSKMMNKITKSDVDIAVHMYGCNIDEDTLGKHSKPNKLYNQLYKEISEKYEWDGYVLTPDAKKTLFQYIAFYESLFTMDIYGNSNAFIENMNDINKIIDSNVFKSSNKHTSFTLQEQQILTALNHVGGCYVNVFLNDPVIEVCKAAYLTIIPPGGLRISAAQYIEVMLNKIGYKEWMAKDEIDKRLRDLDIKYSSSDIEKYLVTLPVGESQSSDCGGVCFGENECDECLIVFAIALHYLTNVKSGINYTPGIPDILKRRINIFSRSDLLKNKKMTKKKKKRKEKKTSEKKRKEKKKE